MNERNDTNGVYFYYFIHILYRQYIGSTMIFTHHHTYDGHARRFHKI